MFEIKWGKLSKSQLSVWPQTQMKEEQLIIWWNSHKNYKYDPLFEFIPCVGKKESSD